VNGGMRALSLAGFPTSTRVPTKESPGKWPGRLFGAAGGALTFPCLAVSAPPPRALEVTGDLDKEVSRDGRSDNDLGARLTGCDGGID
jgi:hypothetical protein